MLAAEGDVQKIEGCAAGKCLIYVRGAGYVDIGDVCVIESVEKARSASVVFQSDDFSGKLNEYASDERCDQHIVDGDHDVVPCQIAKIVVAIGDAQILV